MKSGRGRWFCVTHHVLLQLRWSRQTAGRKWGRGHPLTCSHSSPFSLSQKQFEQLMGRGRSLHLRRGLRWLPLLIYHYRSSGSSVICTRLGIHLASYVITHNHQTDAESALFVYIWSLIQIKRKTRRTWVQRQICITFVSIIYASIYTWRGKIILFDRDRTCSWTSAGYSRRHRHDSFVIPAFISPGLSGIFICPASSAPHLLTDSHVEKKTNKKTGQKDLEEFNTYDESIISNQSTLFIFTSVFSHLIQGSVGWWTSVTRRGVTGGVTCCCCARTDLPNDMRHIQSHYTRVGGIRRPEQKGVWCNCVDLLKSSKLFSGSAHHYNFAPWSLLLQWLFHQKCQMNDHGSLF